MRLGAVAIVASLVVCPAATAGPRRRRRGRSCSFTTRSRLAAPDWTDNPLYARACHQQHLLRGQIRDNNAKWVTRLFTGPPKLLKKSPLTTQFVQPEGHWSDGKPVTCADWRATWQLWINPANNVASRAGFEDIRSVTCKGKTGTVVFKKVHADWETLPNDGVSARPPRRRQGCEQAVAGLDSCLQRPVALPELAEGRPDHGRQEPRYTISPMKLDRVVFRYITDTNARFQAMKAGEGQAMEPQAQLQIADFQKDSNFTVKAIAGYSYEHLDIQFGPKGAAALKAPYVRQALITGINCPQIAQALYATIAPGLPTLHSNIFKTFEDGYVKHQAKYLFSQTKVITIREGQGLHGGPDKPSAGNDKIFSCPGVGKLSFRFSTLVPAPRADLRGRPAAAEVGRHRAVPRLQPAGLLFGTTLPSSDWDIIMFTWVESLRRRSRRRTSSPAVVTSTTATTATARQPRSSTAPRRSSTMPRARSC